MSDWKNNITDKVASGVNTVYADAKTTELNVMPAIIVASIVVFIILLITIFASLNMPSYAHSALVLGFGILVSIFIWSPIFNKINEVMFVLQNPTAGGLLVGTSIGKSIYNQ